MIMKMTSKTELRFMAEKYKDYLNTHNQTLSDVYEKCSDTKRAAYNACLKEAFYRGKCGKIKIISVNKNFFTIAYVYIDYIDNRYYFVVRTSKYLRYCELSRIEEYVNSPEESL